MWGDDAKPCIRRPREGPTSRDGGRKADIFARDVRCHAHMLDGREWPEGAERRVRGRAWTPNGARRRALPAAARQSYLTWHGSVPRPILHAKAKGSGTSMVMPRGGNARVNGEACLAKGDEGGDRRAGGDCGRTRSISRLSPAGPPASAAPPASAHIRRGRAGIRRSRGRPRSRRSGSPHPAATRRAAG